MIETLAKVRGDNVVDAGRRQDLGKVDEERARRSERDTGVADEAAAMTMQQEVNVFGRGA